MSLPPVEIPLGAVRFNSDSQKLEYWVGDVWMQVKTFSPTLDGGARAVCAGMTPNATTESTGIDMITIPTQGNAADFGNLTQARLGLSAYSSRTRGVFHTGLNHNEIDFITIASTGNAQDFGDVLRAGKSQSGISDSHGGLGGF